MDRIDSLLAAAAERHGTSCAVAFGDVELTYTELDERVDALAQRLGDVAGDVRGRRVVVIGPNVPALVAGMFAAWRAGAVAVPLSARLREYELGGILADAEPVAAITVRAYRAYSFVDFLERAQPALARTKRPAATSSARRSPRCSTRRGRPARRRGRSSRTRARSAPRTSSAR